MSVSVDNVPRSSGSMSSDIHVWEDVGTSGGLYAVEVGPGVVGLVAHADNKKLRASRVAVLCMGYCMAHCW